MSTKNINYLFLIVLMLFFAAFNEQVYAGTYWVSPTGTAAWADAESSTPLSGSSCASLSRANANATAGDTINLRVGIYSSYIHPQNSGTLGNRIVWQPYANEHVVITGSNYGIYIDGVDYHVIDGLEIKNVDNGLTVIRNGADYNEIKNNLMHDAPDVPNSGLLIRDDIGSGGSTNNWIHHNTIYGAGYISSDCNDDSNLMKIGTTGGDYHSNNNTIENNVLYWGGHHILETYTKYNVIRNNVMHNEGWMNPPGSCTPLRGPSINGKWGNRLIQIYDGYNQTYMRNLIEGNRLGHADIPPDDLGANALVITSRQNIARYNAIYDAANDGIYLKQGSDSDSDNNRIYNNTVYHTGYGPSHETQLRRHSITINNSSSDNVVKNNIFFDSKEENTWCLGGGDCTANNTTLAGNWYTSSCPSYESGCKTGDPKFVNTDISDPSSTTLPDLSLKGDSGAKDAGVNLTLTNGSGTSSTTLVVDDALFFQDGTWGSALADMKADWIAIGAIDNVVQISSINYSTNTITLASAMSWNDNAPVWLYKKSDGETVLKGDAPDIGANEYDENGQSQTPSSTGNSGSDAGGGGCFIRSIQLRFNRDAVNGL